ncbi:MAG: hypothetical protein AAFW81_01575 [Pseudomonadota bacterium]
MVNLRILTIVAAAMAAGLGAPAAAQTFKMGPTVEIEGGDGPIFAAGGEVIVTGEISGGFSDATLFAAGGDVEIAAEIDGKLMAAGGDVLISGSSDDLSAAGGNVVFNGASAGDASLAGGSLKIGALAAIAGGLDAAAGDITFQGEVGRDANFAGGRVELSGRIGGDVEVVAEKLVITETAVIDGALDFRGPAPADIAEAAVIRGTVSYNEASLEDVQRYRRGESSWSGGNAQERAFGALFWFVASAASGALICVLFPGWAGGAANAGREKPLSALLMGLAILFLTPILATLSMLIVIGLPFGLFLIGVYLALLFVSTIGAGIALGHLLFDRSGEGEAKLLLFFAGLAIVLVLSAAPIVGGPIMILAAAFGVGALSLSLLQALRFGQSAA